LVAGIYVEHRFLLTTCRNDRLLYFSVPVDNEKAGVFAKAIKGSIQSTETQENEQLIHKK